MPSKSIAQQRFMGLVKSAQAGKAKVSGKAKKAARDMKKKDVDDFASTKHDGLPYKVKKESKVRNIIRKMVREVMTEGKLQSQFIIPITDRKKVAHILLKQLKLKVGRDFDYGVGKGASFVLEIPKKIENKVLDKLIRSGVRKIRTESFAGALKKEDRKKFDKERQKQAEVLGYKLAGKSDVKSEIGDATIKEGHTVWRKTPHTGKIKKGMFVWFVKGPNSAQRIKVKHIMKAKDGKDLYITNKGTFEEKDVAGY